MKKQKMLHKRIDVVIAVLILTAALCSCGKKEGNISEEGNKYSFQSFAAPEEVPPWSIPHVCADTVFYVDRDRDTQTCKLYSSDIDGGNFTDMSAYPGDDIGGSDFASDNSGGLWTYATVSEGAKITSIDLLHIAPDGSIISRNRLSDTEFSYDGYPHDIALAADGLLYMLFGGPDPRLYALDADGRLVFSIDDVLISSALVLTNEGLPVIIQPTKEGVLHGDYEGTLILPVDASTHDFSDKIELDNRYNAALDGAGYSLYLVGKGELYGFDLNSGELTRILDLSLMGVENWTDMFALESGNFFLVATTSAYTGYAMLCRDGIAEETVTLSLATMNPINLNAYVAEFNSSHADIKIKMTDYSGPGGQELLSTQIISGNAPDIIDLSSLSSPVYTRKGLLEDLYPYIDADSDYSREEMWPNVMAALEDDGRLYNIVPGFTAVTVAGRAGWLAGSSVEDYINLWNSCSGNGVESLFGKALSRDDFVLNCVGFGANDNFIDYETGACSFNNPQFINLLELSAALPQNSVENYDPIMDIRSGKQALYLCSLYTPDNLDTLNAFFGGEIGLTGLPSGTGSTWALEPYISLGMSSSCENKDAAWEFMRYFLSYDFQAKIKALCIPLRMDVYTQEVEKAYLSRAVEGKSTLIAGDGIAFETEVIPERSAAAMREFLESSLGLMIEDDALNDIIREETAPFYAGIYTAQETAQHIQKRAALYFAEQSADS